MALLTMTSIVLLFAESEAADSLLQRQAEQKIYRDIYKQARLHTHAIIVLLHYTASFPGLN